MAVNMDLPLAPQAAPYRRDAEERHTARLVAVVAEGGYLRVVVQLDPPLGPVVQQGRRTCLRDALAVLVGAPGAVGVRGHPANRAAVDHVGLGSPGARHTLRGAEGRQAHAARRRLPAAEVVLGPRVAGAGAPQGLPGGALLPGGRLGPVERGLALQAEERVDERGEAEGARGDEPAEEREAGGVKQAGHGHQQRSHQVHGRSPGFLRSGAEPAAAAAIEGARLIRESYRKKLASRAYKTCVLLHPT